MVSVVIQPNGQLLVPYPDQGVSQLIRVLQDPQVKQSIGRLSKMAGRSIEVIAQNPRQILPDSLIKITEATKQVLEADQKRMGARAMECDALLDAAFPEETAHWEIEPNLQKEIERLDQDYSQKIKLCQQVVRKTGLSIVYYLEDNSGGSWQIV